MKVVCWSWLAIGARAFDWDTYCAEKANYDKSDCVTYRELVSRVTRECFIFKIYFIYNNNRDASDGHLPR
jgi:hypothetical protein